MELTAIQQLLHPEASVLAGVRARVSQAIAVPDPGVGALLAHVAARHGVRHAVMIGSAGGVTATWLLDGMNERGIVTCLEPDSRRNALLADAAQELGLSDHLRQINAEPADAARRLRDGNYDLIVVQVDRAGPDLFSIAAQLLRVGGVLAVRHATSLDDEAVDALTQRPWVEPVVLDSDGGVVLALRDHDPDAQDVGSGSPTGQ